MTALRPQVLVVEDDPLLGRVIQRILSSEFEVRWIDHGEAALALLREQFFDAVVVDVVLPGISGLAVLADLAERNPAQARRVILATGGSWALDADEQLAACGQPVLEKPFALADLSDAVRRMARQA